MRCLLQGDFNIGKTTLCITHNSKQFPDEWVGSTYGGDGTVIEIEVGRRVTVVYVEVATAGAREDLLAYWPINYHWCDVCLMCFSMVNPRSYENILKEYYAHFTTWRFDIPIVVVGTKCDLVNDVDAVSRLRAKGEAPLTREDGLRLAETINAVGYVECSSLRGLGLDQVFREACKAGLDAKGPRSKRCAIM